MALKTSQELSVQDMDYVLEEHRSRKLADVAEAERMRGVAERGREEATRQLATLQGELASVRNELATFKEELAQRKADWEASVVRIRGTLEARERGVVTQETALTVRETALKTSEDRCRHQWTLLHEAVEQIKAAFATHLSQQGKAFDAILKTLPSGVDQPV